MGKSTPAQPPAPDYSEATREGVYADIETLPTRRKIERAARLGESVTYADKDGQEVTADFTGLGDVELTSEEARGLAAIAPELSQAQLDNLITYGPQFIAAQREQMQQMDPEGFALREQFTSRLRGGEGTAEELVGGGVPVPDYEEVAAPELAETGLTPEGRAMLESQVFGNLAMEDRVTDVQAQQLEQGVRRASAARGQALGSASGLREAISKLEAGGQLGQQRRGEALGLLSSGQTTSDAANRLSQQSFANAMQRVQQVNQARQQGFVGQQQNLGQQLGARQQDISNVQSLLGLQPVAAQGGLMAGLQQGAAPFMTPQMQRGMGLNQGAGAQGAGFASNVFGTQGQMWGVQAQLKSPLERGVGVFGDLASAAQGFGTGKYMYNRQT